MITDPIANYLTSIRNAILAKHASVSIPCSRMKISITKVLLDNGYIQDYKILTGKNEIKKYIKIFLKYNQKEKLFAINQLIRISKPGCRRMFKSYEIPRVLNGLGIAIVSTSKGIITDKQARKLKVGGEVLCHIY